MLRDSSRLILKCMCAAATLCFVSANLAWSQSYKVIYAFGEQAKNPSSGLVVDAAGNAYGTTAEGGYGNRGTVYQLSPTTGFNIIYTFAGHPDGRNPQGNLVFDASGNLYGTTVYGGTAKAGCNNRGCGTVFELTPPGGGQGLWTETLLYSFTGGGDGSNPQSGVILDSAGNLYGTTEFGGPISRGAVFELAPGGSSAWAESVLYGMGQDGANPLGSLTFDSQGNLYGTTFGDGPENGGEVFRLTPAQGGGWNYSIVYGFDGLNGSVDGIGPSAGVVVDAAGNLYGTTTYGGSSGGSGRFSGYGTVFMLTPSGGAWTETILHNFVSGEDGANPVASVVVDAGGNWYGTTQNGGGTNSLGTVFRLTPSASGLWSEDLFRLQPGEGSSPSSPVLLDSEGNAYTTASDRVFEIRR